MRKTLVLLLFLLFLPIPSFNFQCTVRERSCLANEICVLSLNDVSNSHVAECSYFGKKLCCDTIVSAAIRTYCLDNETEILEMAKVVNSHAEIPGLGNYPYKVCIAFEGSPPVCSAKSSCNINETCLLALAKQTNSHVASCDYQPYPYRICCGKFADLYVNQSSIQLNNTSPADSDPILFNITVWNIGDKNATSVNVSCYDNGTYFDSYEISLLIADPTASQPEFAYCDWIATAGTHNISVKVDPDNLIDEYNETNNEAWRIVEVKDYLINVTTDKLFYNSSETVEASGYFYFSTGEGIADANVEVTFLNYTGSTMQSRNVTTDLQGFYSDTFTLPFVMKSGVYKVKVKGYSNVIRENETTYQVFGATRGEQTHSPSSYTSNAITQDNGDTFTLRIEWKNLGPDPALLLNLSLTHSSYISLNSTFEECGNVSAGDSCVKAFRVTINPGTPPGTYFVNSTATWLNNNTYINKTFSYTIIHVNPNPRLDVPEDGIENYVVHNTSKIVGNFTVNSTGNADIQDITFTIVGGTLPASWVTFDPPSISYVSPGNYVTVDVNVSVPPDEEGFYWANVSVKAGNDGEDWFWLNITTGGIVVNLEAGGPYIRSSLPTVVIVGNVSWFYGEPVEDASINLTVYSGSTPVKTLQTQTSSTGKFFWILNDLDVGTYVVVANASYRWEKASSSDKFYITSQYPCEVQTITLNGTARDFDTGELISKGTVKIVIEENGDTASTTFEGGVWVISFTSCLVPGGRYNAVVQITDADTGKSSYGRIQFIAP